MTPLSTAQATLCPAVSPESKRPCELPDTRAAHGIGHVGTHPLGAPHRVGWRTTEAEKQRWEKIERD